MWWREVVWEWWFRLCIYIFVCGEGRGMKEREGGGGRRREEGCSNSYLANVQINIWFVWHMHVQCRSLSWPVILHIRVPMFHRLKPGVRMSPWQPLSTVTSVGTDGRWGCHGLYMWCHVMVMSCFSHLDLIPILNFFPHSFVDLMRLKQEQITT